MSLYSCYMLLLIFHSCLIRQSTSRKIEVDFTVIEESVNNTLVGNLQSRLLSAGKLHNKELDGFEYKFIGKNRYFRIDSVTGDILISSRIDREVLCRDKKTCCAPVPTKCLLKTLVINGKAQGKESQNFIKIVFRIIDINDNSPTWPVSHITLEIPEHTPIYSRFKLPTAVDPDQGPQNTTDHYRLVATSQSMFSLQPELVENKWNEAKQFVLWLQIERDLDRESQEFYQFLISAVDGGNPALTGYVNLNISITDINDQKPQFQTENPIISVEENLPINSKIYQFAATDPDPIDNNRVRYKMGSSVTSEISKTFYIDDQTGGVYIRKHLDYEKSWKPFKIPIAVTDGKHLTETTLTVNVRNQNDNSPEIVIQSHLMDSDGSLWIQENQSANQLIATFTVSDPDDRVKNDEIRCQTNDPIFAISSLDEEVVNELKLITIKSFDREAKPSYLVDIKCSDNGSPVRITTKSLVVNIKDENDSSPKFSKQFYLATLKEGKPHGTFVTKLTATDADSREQTRIRYFLDSYLESGFRIDAHSGSILSKAIFDREKIKEVNITVFATDFVDNNGDLLQTNQPTKRVNTASTTVIVTILDVNDCVPRFEQNSYEFKVEESRSHIRVGKVTAHDDDTSPRNHRVSYSLKTNPGYELADNYFKVTDSGDIYTTSDKIDRERTAVIQFQVVARDHGHTPRSSSVDVLIHIKDINDEIPNWVFPRGGNKSVNMSQEEAVGHKITNVQAVDLDEGPRGQLLYYIVSGNEKDYFDLDSKSGELYLAKPLPNEAVYLHKLFLKVTDQGVSPKVNTCVLEINVLTRSLYHKLNNRHVEKDLIIMICMIVTTLIISLILIVTLVFLRCQFCRRMWVKQSQPYATTVRMCNPDGRSSPTISELPHLLDDLGRPIPMFSRLEALDDHSEVTRDRPPLYYTLETRPTTGFSSDSASLDSGRGCSEAGPCMGSGRSRVDRSYSLPKFASVNPRLVKGGSVPKLAKNCPDFTGRFVEALDRGPHTRIIFSPCPSSRDTTNPSAMVSGMKDQLQKQQLQSTTETIGEGSAESEESSRCCTNLRGPLSVKWMDDDQGYQHLDAGPPDIRTFGSKKELVDTGGRAGESLDLRTYTPLKNHRVSTPNLYSTKQPTSFV